MLTDLCYLCYLYATFVTILNKYLFNWNIFYIRPPCYFLHPGEQKNVTMQSVRLLPLSDKKCYLPLRPQISSPHPGIPSSSWSTWSSGREKKMNYKSGVVKCCSIALLLSSEIFSCPPTITCPLHPWLRVRWGEGKGRGREGCTLTF